MQKAAGLTDPANSKKHLSKRAVNNADRDAWVKSVLKAFDHFRILCAIHESDWGKCALNQSVQRALG